MDFKLHTDLSEIPAEAWNDLASASISDTPFARFEYQSLWWETRGGGEWRDGELMLISAMDADGLVGIAPLFIADHEGRKALLLLGSIEISDYLDLIVKSADIDRFVEGLLDYLSESNRLAHLPIDWYNLPESSPTLRALEVEASRRKCIYVHEIFRSTPHIPLSGDFEAYLAGIDKKQRHEIRRKLRRAGEGSSPAQFEVIQDPGDLEGATEKFLDLMAHDTDKARFLTSSMREHMRGLMHVASRSGFLWMAFLTVNGVRAAAALNFDYGNKLWGYNSAVNRDFLDLSPGWVLLGNQLRWACEHGRTEFDFMRGDEAYKYRFGAVDRHVVRARLTPS